jgi:hypothetical protein
MTHGEATEWFEWDCVPPQFMSLVKKPKASKVKKTAKKSTPKGKATDRVDTLEKRVDAMDTKLEKILEILSK